MKFCVNSLTFFTSDYFSVYERGISLAGGIIPQYKNVHFLTCLYITSAETFYASVTLFLIIYTITLNEIFMYALPHFLLDRDVILQLKDSHPSSSCRPAPVKGSCRPSPMKRSCRLPPIKGSCRPPLGKG
jgi:hypothetical protein